jgi:hypothetical protein
VSFKKFPPEEKWLWYVEGLRRNPQFRAECDGAIKEFIESEVCYSQDELKEAQEKMPDDFGNLLKSPSIIRSFMDLSPQSQSLGKRWGLIEAWHYECPDFPPPINYYVAYPKKFKEVRNINDSVDFRHNPEKYILDNNGMLQLVINPKAPKKEIMAWVKYWIDKIREPMKKGIDKSDSEIIWRFFDLRQQGKSHWTIVQDIYGDEINKINPKNCNRNKCTHRANFKENKIIDKTDCGKKGRCLIADAFLKNVKDGIEKAEKVIESIKPIRVLN